MFKKSLVFIACIVLMSVVILAYAEDVCTDSDGGHDYYVKGTVTFGGTSQTDFCTGSNLTEYYCDGTAIMSESYVCSGGCTDGACLVPTPTPTDTPTPTSTPTPTPVPTPILTSVRIMTATTTVVAGTDFTFTASAYDQNGAVVSDAAISWSITGDPIVGTVASTGVFHASRVGSVFVNATVFNGVQNVSDQRSLTVLAPPPPVRSNGYPAGTLSADTATTTISLTTDKSASCRYTTTSGLVYAEMTSEFTKTNSTSYEAVVGSLQGGRTFTYYVRCRDSYDAVNADDYPISFLVATSTAAVPPVRTGGSPVGATFQAGTTQATLTLVTDMAATCRYATAASTAYETMPYVFSTTGGTSHSTIIGNLQNGSTYHYYVRCKGASLVGNANTNDLDLYFSVSGAAAAAGSSTPLIVMTPNPTPAPASGKAGDIDNDNVTGLLDFNLLMVNWGTNPANKKADLNGDNAVDIFDFNLMMVNWSS